MAATILCRDAGPGRHLRYAAAMTQPNTDGFGTADPEREGVEPAPSRLSLLLLGSGAAALLLAGLLLWWREGDRLFTDGLIAAIVACF